MKLNKKCNAEKCEREYDCYYEEVPYCSKHYKQLMRYGKVLERTKGDRNEIINCGKYSEIILYDINNKEKARAIIDTEDIEKIKNIKWKYNSIHGYVENSKHKLHNVIMNFSGTLFMQVDHLNRNKLDNRKENLKIGTAQENVINRGMQKNNKSGVKGVSYINKTKVWYASIGYNNKIYSLGVYKNFDDAVLARRNAELKYFGKYST